jgi:hypothetical protein
LVGGIPWRQGPSCAPCGKALRLLWVLCLGSGLRPGGNCLVIMDESYWIARQRHQRGDLIAPRKMCPPAQRRHLARQNSQRSETLALAGRRWLFCRRPFPPSVQKFATLALTYRIVPNHPGNSPPPNSPAFVVDGTSLTLAPPTLNSISSRADARVVSHPRVLYPVREARKFAKGSARSATLLLDSLRFFAKSNPLQCTTDANICE